MHLHSMFKSAFLLLSGTALYAAPGITLDVTIPSQYTQIPHAICATKTGGFLIGATATDSVGGKNAVLIRTDKNGIKNGTHSFNSLFSTERTRIMHLKSILSTALLMVSGTALYATPVITLDLSFPSPNTETPHAI